MIYDWQLEGDCVACEDNTCFMGIRFPAVPYDDKDHYFVMACDECNLYGSHAAGFVDADLQAARVLSRAFGGKPRWRRPKGGILDHPYFQPEVVSNWIAEGWATSASRADDLLEITQKGRDRIAETLRG